MMAAMTAKSRRLLSIGMGCFFAAMGVVAALTYSKPGSVVWGLLAIVSFARAFTTRPTDA